jgi:hypothetical protein
MNTPRATRRITLNGRVLSPWEARLLWRFPLLYSVLAVYLPDKWASMRGAPK